MNGLLDIFYDIIAFITDKRRRKKTVESKRKSNTIDAMVCDR